MNMTFTKKQKQRINRLKSSNGSYNQKPNDWKDKKKNAQYSIDKTFYLRRHKK